MKLIVTGGASGLGEALVKRLNAHDVWILDRNEPTELSPGHQFIQVNLADQQSIDGVLELLPDSVDGLANVAGIAQSDDAELVVAVNFLAVRHLSTMIASRLVQGGRIVNVSSTAGRDWQKRYDKLIPLLETDSYAAGLAWCRDNIDVVARDPYTMSKRLATALTLRTAQDGIENGYTVNSVSPGPIATPLYPQFESLMGAEQSDWLIAQTKRAAQPEDIAEVVDLLLTGDCGWLNGVDIPVDGGYTAGMESGWIDFSQSPIMQQRQ